jgi:hypothetical protein
VELALEMFQEVVLEKKQEQKDRGGWELKLPVLAQERWE